VSKWRAARRAHLDKTFAAAHFGVRLEANAPERASR